MLLLVTLLLVLAVAADQHDASHHHHHHHHHDHDSVEESGESDEASFPFPPLSDVEAAVKAAIKAAEESVSEEEESEEEAEEEAEEEEEETDSCVSGDFETEGTGADLEGATVTVRLASGLIQTAVIENGTAVANTWKVRVPTGSTSTGKWTVSSLGGSIRRLTINVDTADTPSVFDILDTDEGTPGSGIGGTDLTTDFSGTHVAVFDGEIAAEGEEAVGDLFTTVLIVPNTLRGETAVVDATNATFQFVLDTNALVLASDVETSPLSLAPCSTEDVENVVWDSHAILTKASLTDTLHNSLHIPSVRTAASDLIASTIAAVQINAFGDVVKDTASRGQLSLHDIVVGNGAFSAFSSNTFTTHCFRTTKDSDFITELYIGNQSYPSILFLSFPQVFADEDGCLQEPSTTYFSGSTEHPVLEVTLDSQGTSLQYHASTVNVWLEPCEPVVHNYFI